MTNNSNWIYGVIGSDGGHIDTALTERGAKRYATIHGYAVVTRVHRVSLAVEVVAHKRGCRWYAGGVKHFLN